MTAAQMRSYASFIHEKAVSDGAALGLSEKELHKNAGLQARLTAATYVGAELREGLDDIADAVLQLAREAQ